MSKFPILTLKKFTYITVVYVNAPRSYVYSYVSCPLESAFLHLLLVLGLCFISPSVVWQQIGLLRHRRNRSDRTVAVTQPNLTEMSTRNIYEV
jgi:hypothetical protein